MNIDTADPRLKLMSYSSLLTLHECPRKFQLYRLSAAPAAVINDSDAVDEAANTDDSLLTNITFAYGHAVGLGIQLALQGLSEESILLALFTSWPLDLDDEDTKSKKSFYLAVAAVQRFMSAYANQLILPDYELVYLPTGEAACELSFRILFPHGFIYRGHIDAVLRHRETENIIVLENKTTKSTAIRPATYQNSPQALSYALILDQIFGDLSAYNVLYLIYKSTEYEFEQMSFPKDALQRAMWIQEILLDIEMMKLYVEQDYFPMRGENCINKYRRECKYFSICHMNTELLTKHLTDEQKQNAIDKEAEIDYTYTFDLREVLTKQLGEEG